MKRDVTIKAKKVGNNIEFDMVEKNQDTEILVFNKTNDNMKKTDHYDIDFVLQNVSGANLEFVQVPDDVIYISKGSDTHLPKCPKNSSGNGQTNFTVTSVTATTLSVHNPDDDICFYKFALRFIDKDNGGAIKTFDPIFGNQNGGLASQPPGGGGTSSAVAFVGGVLLGAAGTVLATGLLS
jgi:hypothetical protein